MSRPPTVTLCVPVLLPSPVSVLPLLTVTLCVSVLPPTVTQCLSYHPVTLCVSVLPPIVTPCPSTHPVCLSPPTHCLPVSVLPPTVTPCVSVLPPSVTRCPSTPPAVTRCLATPCATPCVPPLSPYVRLTVSNCHPVSDLPLTVILCPSCCILGIPVILDHVFPFPDCHLLWLGLPSPSVPPKQPPALQLFILSSHPGCPAGCPSVSLGGR